MGPPPSPAEASPGKRWLAGILAVAGSACVALAGGQPSDSSTSPEAPEHETRGPEEEWVNLFPETIQDQVHAIREFFGTHLPDALEQYDLSLDYTPKFGDLGRRDFLRFPLTLWYGFSDHTDLHFGTTFYTPNPFRSNGGRSGGLGQIRAGARNRVATDVLFFDQVFAGLDLEFPIGRPPPGVSDYYGRLRPFVTGVRDLETLRHTYFLLGLTHDYAFDLPGRDAREAHPRIHWTDIAPGIIYRPSNVSYLVEYTLRLIEEDSDFRRAHRYKAGFIWELPRRRSPRFLPGDWRIDMAYQLTDEQERDLNHAVSVRVNVRFDVRRFAREVREARQQLRQ